MLALDLAVRVDRKLRRATGRVFDERRSLTMIRDTPAGWDAELYRNGQLLAFTSPNGDGRHEFPDVPLHMARTASRSCCTARFEGVAYARYMVRLGKASAAALRIDGALRSMPCRARPPRASGWARWR